MEKILCAAIHYHDGIIHEFQPDNISRGFVLSGYRHNNINYLHYNLIYSDRGSNTEGFLTQKNRFVDRHEAVVIAMNANQLLDPEYLERGTSYELSSKDLY